MFLNPKNFLETIETTGHEVVVDIGAGQGSFTLPIAKKIKQGDGHVYAVDVQKNLLLRLLHSAEEEKLRNISVVHADAESDEGVPLGDNISSLTIISNVLFQTDEKLKILKEAARLTHPGGLLLLVDWKSSCKGIGPRAEQVITENEAIKLAMSVGFSLSKELSPSIYHWGVLLRKNSIHQ